VPVGGPLDGRGRGSEMSKNAPDKLLKYAEIIQVLENEIKWCLDNPDKAFSAEYRKGFINGLIQAKYLTTELAHLRNREQSEKAEAAK
jgi:hypothetical protein